MAHSNERIMSTIKSSKMRITYNRALNYQKRRRRRRRRRKRWGGGVEEEEKEEKGEQRGARRRIRRKKNTKSGLAPACGFGQATCFI